MDLNISKNKILLSDEKVKKYKDMLKIAEPYTIEDIEKIPLDSCDFDIDRMNAFNAKRALKEAGLI